MNDSWNYSALIIQLTTWFAAKDGVGLAGASLPIGHDDAIEAIEDISDDGLCELFVSKLLVAVHRQAVVENKVALIKTLANQRYLRVLNWVVSLHTKVLALFPALLNLLLQKRPDSDYNCRQLIV
jgi:hypothetical protein